MTEPSNNKAPLSETELITAHLPMVKKIASALASHTSYNYMDDLIQEGSIGLLMAARAYDPKYKVHFKTYAGHRIIGRMKDFLRTNNIFGIRNHWFTRVPLDYAMKDSIYYIPDTTDILKNLDKDEREIMEMFYIEGYTRKEIGSVKELSITQVSEIIDRAKEKLLIFRSMLLKTC